MFDFLGGLSNLFGGAGGGGMAGLGQAAGGQNGLLGGLVQNNRMFNTGMDMLGVPFQMKGGGQGATNPMAGIEGQGASPSQAAQVPVYGQQPQIDPDELGMYDEFMGDLMKGKSFGQFGQDVHDMQKARGDRFGGWGNPGYNLARSWNQWGIQ